MAYIASDGCVGGKKTWWTYITDFFSNIFLLISLFFSTMTSSRSLDNRPQRDNRTFAQRNGGHSSRPTNTSGGQRLGRGANIRGVNQLGAANCVGGGG